MAAEWTHHISYSPSLIAVNICGRDTTAENIKDSKEFGINLAAEDQNILCSLAGRYSGSNGMLEVGHNTTYIYPYTYDNTKNTTTIPKPSPNFLFFVFLNRTKNNIVYFKASCLLSRHSPDQDQNSYSDSTSLYLPASQGSIPYKLCLSWMLCFDSPMPLSVYCLIIWRLILQLVEDLPKYIVITTTVCMFYF